MRAAEARAIAAGTSVETLMERAGMAAAEAIRRYAGQVPALVLCGPGNNGGDGYVIARALQEGGSDVRVAALGEPKSDAARAARAGWQGEVETLAEVGSAPLLVDALFGTGLTRPLDEDASRHLRELAEQAQTRVAIDLPSGAATDDGCLLSAVPEYHLTVTFATLKPSHLLHPAARHMGRIVVARIGVEGETSLHELCRPHLSAPGPADHKYSRGYVLVVGGEMPGAAALTAAGALRAGAGYVRLTGETAAALPHAIVGGADLETALADPRVGAVAVGPGLGRDASAQSLLETMLAAEAPLILDADALTLAAGEGPAFFRRAKQMPILTPHAAEFARLFEHRSGSKVDLARRAAEAAGAVLVYKGADTVVASPDGRAAIAPSASHWLATAGTGDVLTGVVAAMRASGLDAFEAACAGVWLHGRAAQLAGPALIADDLLDHLPAAVAECL
jgi:hydroxyethylthiazole kinase-like uncharacterized protein yjeF